MKLLKEMICKIGLNFEGETIHREAVRGVIIKDKKLLMIFSKSNGDYKFPGGGVNEGESHETALSREINEECGGKLLSIVEELGKFVEIDAPLEPEYDVFKMVSYYYICDVNPNFGKQNLDEYEKDLGFTPVWVGIDQAIQENRRVVASGNHPRWTPRETFMLEHLKREFEL